MAIKSIACAAIPLMMAATLPAQAITIEQLNSQVQQLNKRISSGDQRFRINGFASFSVAQSDEAVRYDDISDELNFRRYTKAGIQMTFNLDSKSSIITQLVSTGQGDNNFNTQMDWGYFKHEIGHGLTAKFGRFRGPYYMLSEYLDVTYAVPWTSMPAENYAILSTLANVEGADLTWSGDTGDFVSQVQVVVGRSDASLFTAKDLVNIGYTLSGDTWSVRAGYTQATIVANDPGIQGAATAFGNDAENDGTFVAVGFRWEPSDFLVLGEYTSSAADGIVQDEDAYYLTVGYRIGQWMPHLTVAHLETTDDEDRSAAVFDANGQGLIDQLQAAVDSDLLPVSQEVEFVGQIAGLTAAKAGVPLANNSDSDRIGLGVRYDFSPGVAMKLQYDMITLNDGNDNGAGLFNSDDFGAALGASNPPDSVNILTFTVDTVF